MLPYPVLGEEKRVAFLKNDDADSNTRTKTIGEWKATRMEGHKNTGIGNRNNDSVYDSV